MLLAPLADLFAAVFEFLPTAFFTFGLHVVVLVVKIVFALNNSQSLYSCILLQLLIVSKSCETFSWFVGIFTPPLFYFYKFDIRLSNLHYLFKLEIFYHMYLSIVCILSQITLIEQINVNTIS